MAEHTDSPIFQENPSTSDVLEIKPFWQAKKKGDVKSITSYVSNKKQDLQDR